MTWLANFRLLKVRKVLINFLRTESVNAVDHTDRNDKEKESHVFYQRLTKEKLVEYLAENVVYNSDGIIATNKPYGIGRKQKTKTIDNYFAQTFNELYLDEILPELSERLGCDQLHLSKAPERYASGVTILTTSDEAHKAITKALKRTKPLKIWTDTYIAVVLGCPKLTEQETKFAIKINRTGNKAVPVVLNQWSKNEEKSHKLGLVSWKHKVLTSSPLASLVQVNLSNIHNNSLKLYLATKCFSPVLGDVLYSSRIKNVMGVLLLDDPFNCIATLQKLDPKMLEALKITQEEVKIIPNHVHLQSLVLPIKKKAHLYVSVPPPESFIWSCQQLKLDEAFHEEGFLQKVGQLNVKS